MPNFELNPLSDRMFFRFSAFIRNELGIKMPEIKKTMLQARLQKRLRKLGIRTFEEYHDYVFSPRGTEEELPNMIDAVTTNKTDFFREPKHFEYLTQAAIPGRLRGLWKRRLPVNAPPTPEPPPKKLLRVWSAGCSSGEEAYTLAMVLSDFAERHACFDYSVLATDISTKMLRTAALGIYDHERVKPVPIMLRKKYLLKSKDENKKLVRITPELRSLVRFRRLNLMDSEFFIREMMDFIFFRNVLIYFDRPVQEAVLNRIANYLHPDGYMFLGHSETLSGLDVPLYPVATAVYRKR